MSDTVQEIKDRLSIVDVVAPYMKLTKAGKYHRGLCPFHNEKTPSFMVSPDRGFYHCFGCNRGGDMFTFIEEIEGVDFRGTLKLLAEKAGVEISAERPENRDKKEKLYAVLTDAAEFFETTLSKEKPALAYLKSRGVSTESIARWRIGYAPRAWQGALKYLLEKKHDEAHIEAAGLIKKPEEQEKKSDTARVYDRFRGRIMFPIRDVSGRVVGFSGRLFPEEKGAETAKYINSPETSLFDKSHVLYGLDYAKTAIRKYNFAILVEGQFDLVMAHQTPYTNTVALSGTAFTEHHARLIKRYTENLILAFDGDRAGIAASGRAAALALASGLNVKIAALPPGEDPADSIQRDPSLWKEALRGAEHVVDFYLAYLKTLQYDERRFKLEVSRVVLPYVAAIKNAIDQSHFITRVASVLAVPEDAVRHELKKLETGNEKHNMAQPSSGAAYTPPVASSEPFLSRGDTLERLLVGIVYSLDDGDHTALHELVQKRLMTLIGAERIQSILNSPADARASLIEGDLFFESHDREGDSTLLLEELFSDFEKELKREQYREVLAKLRSAEKENDAARVEHLLNEANTLAKEL